MDRHVWRRHCTPRGLCPRWLPALSRGARTQIPAMRLPRPQCSSLGCRHQDVRGQADGLWDCAARTDPSPPSPSLPSPSPAGCVMLWSRLAPARQDAKKRTDEKDIPACTKVRKGALKKNPSGGGTAVGGAPRPRAEREGELLLLGGGGRGLRGRGSGAVPMLQLCAVPASAAAKDGGSGQQSAPAFCSPLCPGSGSKDLVQVLAA